MVYINSIDILRGKAIYEYPDGNYFFKEEPKWKFWYRSVFMGVSEYFSFHRMSKKEQIEFNSTQPVELQLTIK